MTGTQLRMPATRCTGSRMRVPPIALVMVDRSRP
jgi:hypothetical protein